MIVAAYDGGVRIELETQEALDLAEFLNQFYEGADCVPDILSARLDEALEVKR